MVGPVERGLDGVSTTYYDGSRLALYYFLRIDLPAPNGIIRYTNYPQGYVGDIDGAGSQTWLHADIKPSSIIWSQQKPEDVAWVEIWNLDNVWNTLLLNYDIEFKPVALWQAAFDPTTRALLGRPRFWSGRSDKCENSSGYMKIALVGERSQFSVEAPFITVEPTCQNVFQDGFSCQYAKLANPGGLSVVDGGTGGGLSAGTYTYAVSAVGMGGIVAGGPGETAPAASGSVTIALNHKVTISWSAVPGAVAYNLYGRSGPLAGLQFIRQVTGLTTTEVTAGGLGATIHSADTTGQDTTCDHSRGACAIKQNQLHFVGWDEILTALNWRQTQ